MNKKIAFIFPGQGSQKIGMGKDFYDFFPKAKEVFQEIDQALSQNLSQIIFAGDQEELTKTENAQPALMAVSLAILHSLLGEIKIPLKNLVSSVAGHSLGEYSALAASSAFSISDAAKILKIRGEAMRDAGLKTKGGMAAIIGTDIKIAETIAEKASEFGICQVANDNSEGQIVISGAMIAIEKAIEIGKEFGAKKIIPLPVSGAFHSELVAEAANKVEIGLGSIKFYDPILPVFTNVTASSEQKSENLKSLLVRQVTSRVRWRESILAMEKFGVTDFVEIGSGNVLTGLVKRISAQANASNISSISDLEKFILAYC